MHIAHCNHSRDYSIGRLESHVNSNDVIMHEIQPLCTSLFPVTHAPSDSLCYSYDTHAPSDSLCYSHDTPKIVGICKLDNSAPTRHTQENWPHQNRTQHHSSCCHFSKLRSSASLHTCHLHQQLIASSKWFVIK